MTAKAKRHVVIDVEAILDPAIPVKAGKTPTDRFNPPVSWEVVALGAFSFVDFEPELFGCLRGENERAKISAYASYLERDRPCVVGWNCRYFDNPVIGHRALRYGIPMPWWYGSARGPRYRYGSDSIDLKDTLSDNGAAMTGDMNQTARLIGWPGKGETTGEDVAGLHAAGDHEAIDRYCLEDVAHQAAIWLRYELLRGGIKPRDWPRLAHRLLVFLEKQPASAAIVAAVDRALYVGPEYSGQLSL